MAEEKNSQERYEPKHFHVCIFGSARIKEGDPNYHIVYELSKMIAKEGMDVVTGGGPGLMEAANRGHKDGQTDLGTHSVGLTIKLPKEQDTNPHLDVKKDFSRFSERLDNFMLLSNAVVVAPGGVGTLLEFFYTWQLVQVKHTCDIPIILLGEMWPELISWVKRWPVNNGLISPDECRLLYLASNCEEAMHVIQKAYEDFKEGKTDFCLNHKKYRIE